MSSLSLARDVYSGFEMPRAASRPRGAVPSASPTVTDRPTVRGRRAQAFAQSLRDVAPRSLTLQQGAALLDSLPHGGTERDLDTVASLVGTSGDVDVDAALDSLLRRVRRS